MSTSDTTAILQRILAAVDKEQPKRWVEIASAVVLSLATLGSAWCAYQSTLWGGVQTFRLAAANVAGREASQHQLSALQFRAFDASMFISYMDAKIAGNHQLEEFLYQRFRPETKVAVDAWLKLDPFNNPAAPPGPFRMAEYVQQELIDAKLREEFSTEKFFAAQQANEASDTYVLLTVMFASVLFFGGIGGTFDSRRLRISVFTIALVLLTVTLAALARMPVCRE